MAQNAHESSVRETYFINLRYLFNSSKNIPIALVSDPLVNAFTNRIQLETFDFDFFNYVSMHPKTNEKSGLLLIDMLSKVYMDQLSAGNAAKVPLLKLIERFISSDKVQEWVKKYVTMCLSKYM